MVCRAQLASLFAKMCQWATGAWWERIFWTLLHSVLFCTFSPSLVHYNLPCSDQNGSCQAFNARKDPNPHSVGAGNVSDKGGRRPAGDKENHLQPKKAATALPTVTLPPWMPWSGAPKKTSSLTDKILKWEVISDPSITAVSLKNRHPTFLKNIAVRENYSTSAAEGSENASSTCHQEAPAHWDHEETACLL